MLTRFIIKWYRKMLLARAANLLQSIFFDEIGVSIFYIFIQSGHRGV